MRSIRIIALRDQVARERVIEWEAVLFGPPAKIGIIRDLPHLAFRLLILAVGHATVCRPVALLR